MHTHTSSNQSSHILRQMVKRDIAANPSGRRPALSYAKIHQQKRTVTRSKPVHCIEALA